MRSPLSEPGFAPHRVGIRFGLYVETAFGLYQQLLQLRMHGLFRRLSHRSDQASDRRREDDDAGRHRHFLQRPLCRQYGRERLRSLCRALPDPSRAHGPLQRDADNPALCIGCGGCESICPVRPMRAIIVKSNVEHKFVEKPKEEEIKEVEVDDFGF